MCGITAIFAYHPDAPPVDRKELRAVRDHMATRGPDGQGEWYSTNGRIGLGHRRLSIIDLSEAGAQPMTDPATGNVIVFNGEIYNYLELRANLEGKGYRFRSNSDTEVLLALYEKFGHRMVDFLRGMYVFAIWDEIKQGLFLARDPFGIKPLYVHDNGKTLRIASQVKALHAGGIIPREIESAGHAGFYLWGHVPEPYTFYKGILAFQPGTTLWIDNLGMRDEQQFWSVRGELAKASKNKPQMSIREAQEKLDEALRDSIKHHLIADVPVGVFLSSGLDSTTIAALASEVGAELRTVTLGFDEFSGTKDDEVPLAEGVAQKYGAKHQTVWVTKVEFQAEFESLLHAMDQPSIDGVNSYFVSLAAKKAGLKVALSGLGGDELFGGYSSFSQIPRSVKSFHLFSKVPRIGVGVRRLLAPCVRKATSSKYSSILEYGGTFGGAYLLSRCLFLPWELPQMMDTDMAAEGLEKLQTLSLLDQSVTDITGDFYKVSALEMTFYMRNQLLRDADWASMAHSLEVRVPLVDRLLLERVAPLMQLFGSSGKKQMALTPTNQLPDTILKRPKTGFTIPVRQWLLGKENGNERGLRGWAKHLYREFTV